MILSGSCLLRRYNVVQSSFSILSIQVICITSYRYTPLLRINPAFLAGFIVRSLTIEVENPTSCAYLCVEYSDVSINIEIYPYFYSNNTNNSLFRQLVFFQFCCLHMMYADKVSQLRQTLLLK